MPCDNSPAIDKAAFFRPIAHRGLHNAAEGVVENSASAFAAAIAAGYGIECDLRPARGGEPMVFHDLELGRLIDRPGRIGDYDPAKLQTMTYAGAADKTGERMISFAGLLKMVAGKVPLMVELKNEWEAPDRAFLGRIADLSKAYQGPLALKSFDPALMTVMRELAPAIPRGIVAGKYQGDGWWQEHLGPVRRYCLSHLLESAPARPSFISYHVKDLPTLATWTARQVFKLPLFTWTVRTPEDRIAAAKWADAAIFEGFRP